jgi:dethiobiotin synthetase/adenosylmethionine--8-amino-7-oxononanoate aminotransferase
MKEDGVTVIDSRYGEEIVVADRQRRSSLRPVYDGCASWWTQGMDAKHVPGMALHVAEAVGRYGHVIFPRNIHQPALELAKKALDTVGSGWASRVFFSDNGSTAVEVALKMAFRKYMKDHDILENDEISVDVLGVQGAYHGDTLGTMDAVAPSVFNGRLQTPWFKGRGRFLDPPTIQLRNGKVLVDIPEDIKYEREAILSDVWDLESIFSNNKRDPDMQKAYKQYIEEAIIDHPTRIGACIIEPIVQGAGGMRMVDPEFHRAMSIVCKEKRIPLVVDEVFTGMWRLGAPSAAVHLLNIKPDIGCYAKLLTGGMVPMSLTLASEDVFQAFQGDSKAEALLHGHSYTAHPIGCAAGVYFFNSIKDINSEGIANLWDQSKLKFLSNMPAVKGLFALGTVISVQLETANQSGYESNAAEELAAKLNEKSIYARPLGDVIYIMVTPFTSRSTCDDLLQKLVDCLLLE